jgi:nitrile hydratase
MSRVHDMGGRFGDGPVLPEPVGQVFHEPWHGRSLAVVLAVGFLGQWNIDVGRHSRERLAPTDYARFSYYEKWISALADMLVEKGMVTRGELVGEDNAVPSELAERKRVAAEVTAILESGGPADRPSDIKAAFKPGDAVMTRRLAQNVLSEGGHTRLPGYAAGAKGRVVMLHGTHVLPDSAAHGLGDAAEPLYAVAFPASELWANPEHPRDEVVLDLWQSYLSRA